MSPSGSLYDVAALREHEFPQLGSSIFMNAASFTPLPRRSLEAISDYNDRRADPRRLGDLDIPDALVRARAAAARLVGAQADEIALGPNTQVGLNLAAGFLVPALRRPDARRRIVLSNGEFPANVYPWLALEREGAIVEIVPTDEAGLPREDALLEALDREDTGVLALSAVQFSTGWRADLERLGQVTRERGILFVVDAIQALGAQPLDVGAAHIDILSSGGQKWLCGPWGSGFTYVRRELITRFEPLFPGWLSFTSSLDFTRLLDYGRELLPDARRFEMATVASQDAIGLAHSIELLLELGPGDIWSHIRAVQRPLLDWVAGRDDVSFASDVAEKRRSGILCFRPPRVEAVFARLQEAGVLCSLREGAIRLAPHFYSTPAEMERVTAVLEEALGR